MAALGLTAAGITAAGVSAAGNVVSGAANGLFGLLGQRNQHEYNMEETEHNLRLQYKYNSMGARDAYQRQIDFYKNFQSYQAQIKQMKEAGLNPALMYGMGGASGAGGTNSQNAASVNGGVGGTGLPQLGIGGLGDGIADAMLKEAEANKANAEADSLRGKDGTKGAAEIKKLITEAKLTTQQSIMAEIDNKWRHVMNETQINQMLSQIDAAFNNYQLGWTKLTLEMDMFQEEKRQFNLSHGLEKRKLEEQKRQFYDQLDQNEHQFRRSLQNAIDTQTRDIDFKSESQEKIFKHEMKKAWINAITGAASGGLGIALLKTFI